MMVDLPYSYEIDYRSFQKIFENYTNSYKFLFFKAMLVLNEKQPEQLQLTYQDIFIEMIIQAWVPKVFFKLSFGVQDQFNDIIFEIMEQYEIEQNARLENVQSIIWKHKDVIYEQYHQKILKYVQYRLLTPFFASELQGKADAKKNSMIADFSSDTKCFYFIDDDRKMITINPNYKNYLRKNYNIINHWYQWNFCKYLQSKNQNTPNVINKLVYPERQSLQTISAVWKEVIVENQLRDIYSNNIFDLADISIDHFIPFSFVMHNQTWNLVPTNRSYNSSKSDSLPEWQYFDTFATQQFLLFDYLRNHNKKTYLEHYINDLFILNNERISETQFRSKLEETISPLHTIAHNQGFDFWNVPSK